MLSVIPKAFLQHYYHSQQKYLSIIQFTFLLLQIINHALTVFSYNMYLIEIFH